MSNGVRLKIIRDSGVNWYYNRQTKHLFTNALLEPVRILQVTEDKIKDVINFANMLVEKYNYYPYLINVIDMNKLNF